MTQLQWKQLEEWGVILTLFLVVWLFQDNPAIARAAFLPAIVYLVINWNTVLCIRRAGPTPGEVIQNSRHIRIGLFVCIGLQLAIAYFFLLTGRDLGEVLTGYGSLTLAVLFPVLPAIVSSELARFHRLGKIEH